MNFESPSTSPALPLAMESFLDTMDDTNAQNVNVSIPSQNEIEIQVEYDIIYQSLLGLCDAYTPDASTNLDFSPATCVKTARNILKKRIKTDSTLHFVHIMGSSSYNLRTPSSDEDLLIVFSHPNSKKPYHHKKNEPDFAAYPVDKFVQSLTNKPSVPNIESLFSNKFLVTTPFFQQLVDKKGEFLTLATVGSYLGWAKQNLKTAFKYINKEWDNEESASKIFKSLYQTVRLCIEAKRILEKNDPMIWWPDNHKVRNLLKWIRSLPSNQNKNNKVSQELAKQLVTICEQLVISVKQLKQANSQALPDSISDETIEFLETWAKTASSQVGISLEE